MKKIILILTILSSLLSHANTNNGSPIANSDEISCEYYEQEYIGKIFLQPDGISRGYKVELTRNEKKLLSSKIENEEYLGEWVYLRTTSVIDGENSRVQNVYFRYRVLQNIEESNRIIIVEIEAENTVYIKGKINKEYTTYSTIEGKGQVLGPKLKCSILRKVLN